MTILLHQQFYLIIINRKIVSYKYFGLNMKYLFEAAVIYAAVHHKGQFRKLKKKHYLLHPMEVAQNMKANGGFIPGIRPGKATVEYLNRVMTRITFVGAIFLAAVAILPTIVSQLGGLNFHFGGTSLLIAVGVALDTMKQLENQMVMRNYSGFLK